jgi:hypothetical protein
MRRRTRWLFGLLAALLLLGVAGRLALPAGLRWLVARQIRAATDRPASIDEVRLGLRAGWVHLRGLRVSDRGSGPPLLELRSLDLRIHWASLLGGVVRIRELTLAGPTVRLARTESRALNISDLLARPRPTAASKGWGLPLVVERLRIVDGRVVFEDRTLAPARTVEAGAIRVDLERIATLPGERPGRGTASLALAGAPLALTVDTLALVPLRVRARAELEGLDLSPLWGYIPVGTALRPEGGRAGLRLDVAQEGAAARLEGQLTVTGLTARRAGPAPALVEVPRVTVTARDVVHQAGSTTLGWIEVVSEPTLVDGTVSPPRRYAVQPLRVTLEGASLTAGRPGQVHLEAGLPGGARLDVRGVTDLGARTARLAVLLAGLEAARLAPYVPPVSPVTVARGRLGAALDVAYEAPVRVEVNGDVTATGLVLVRRDRDEPFTYHPQLRLGLEGAAWRDGALAVRRLTLAGGPTLTDATASPPLRAEFTRLVLVADDVTWPSRGPARVRLDGIVRDGGRGTIAGTFDPGTLATDVQVTVADVALARAAGYLPPAWPVTLAQGRLGGRVGVRFDRAGGLRLGADGAVADLVLRRPGGVEPFVEDGRVGFRVGGLVWRERQLAIAELAVTGAPTLTAAGAGPPRRLALRGLTLTAQGFAWPPRGPVATAVEAALPGGGLLEARARVDLGARAGHLSIVVRDAALGGFQDWLVVAGPVSGTLDAELRGSLDWATGLALGLGGGVRGRDLALGLPDRPLVSVRALELADVAVRWPEEIRVARLGVRGLSGLVEREPDGRLPLRALIAPRGPGSAHRNPVTAAGASSAPAGPAPAGPPPGSAVPSTPASPPAGAEPRAAPPGVGRPLVRIDEAVVEDGDLRFIDRGGTPFYSEELSRLVLRMRGFTTDPEGEAALTVQGTVGGTGMLDLAGRLAPFREPFFLEVEGELREFELPRTNPMFRRLFAWLLKRGSLTTRLHYRIVGDQLEALNDVQLEGLAVERDPGGGAGRRLGLPLGLLVAIATDSRGGLAFPLPVRGRLGSPQFSLGGAIWAAVRNALVNVVAGPVNAIGRLFRSGEGEPTVEIDPLEFATGAAVLTAEGDRQLQRVADFLRAAPNAVLELRPVVTEADLQRLRTQEVVARIQRVQRDRRLESFPAAAAQHFREAVPDVPVPEGVDAVVDALREREPAPAAAAAQLAARRLDVARDTLVARGGIDAARLRTAPDPPPPGGTGTGRVEFALAE